jgi:hypothetical protein
MGIMDVFEEGRHKMIGVSELIFIIILSFLYFIPVAIIAYVLLKLINKGRRDSFSTIESRLERIEQKLDQISGQTAPKQSE